MIIFALIAFAYLVGSIPTGYCFAKFFFNIDVTKNGSKNIGATNISRLLGKKYFLPIFLLDALKAFGALSLCSWFAPEHAYTFSIAILIGNAYSVFLKFKGGKGVATVVGLACSLLPWQLATSLVTTWIIVLSITKTPFIASLCSMMIITIIQHIFFQSEHTFYWLFICFWVFMRHWSNITAWHKKANS